jgi:hypothetical protein
LQQTRQPLLARQYGPSHCGKKQDAEGLLGRKGAGVACGAGVATAAAGGAPGTVSGEPAATTATKRTVASWRNLRMVCSFLFA